MRQSISIAVQIIRSHPDNNTKEIFRLLLESGIDEPEAAQLLVLVPHAYGRVGLAGCGVSFSDNYICLDKGGEPGRERRLNDLPLWKEAVAFARQEVSSGVGGDLLAVAGRSSEIDAINKALHAGRKLENLVISPPVFMWPEFASSIGSVPVAKKSRRWWQIWK